MTAFIERKNASMCKLLLSFRISIDNLFQDILDAQI